MSYWSWAFIEISEMNGFTKINVDKWNHFLHSVWIGNISTIYYSKKRSKTAKTENGNSSYFVIVNSSLVYKKEKIFKSITSRKNIKKGDDEDDFQKKKKLFLVSFCFFDKCNNNVHVNCIAAILWLTETSSQIPVISVVLQAGLYIQ